MLRESIVNSLGIVDNDPLSLVALSNYVKSTLPEVRITWGCDSGQLALTKFRSMAEHPACVLVDISMPDMDGLTFIRKLRERDARTYLIAMTSFPLGDYVNQAVDAGAQSLVSKRNPRKIVQTVACCNPAQEKIVCEGVHFTSPKAAFVAISRQKRSGVDKLTDIENQIIDSSRRGMTSFEIGKKIGMSATTVNTHLTRACRKMGARNRVQLVAMWIEATKSNR